MEDDGVHFKDQSQAVPILYSDRIEERLVCEGAWLMYKDGTYFLFYSSGWFFEAKYHMRVAKSNNLLGPYEKLDKPVIETDWVRYNNGMNSTFLGPGHGSVVLDHAGDWWLLYHSWLFGHLAEDPGRVVLLDKLTWEDGWPRVGSPSDTIQQAPVIYRPAVP
jgi:arabinan endo-1,5-alpha-L-arabinosidase